MILFIGGGIYWIFGRSAAIDLDAPLLIEIERKQFINNVEAEGELESAENLEFRCEVNSKLGRYPQVISLIPEGTKVVEGDVMIELDSAAVQSAYDSQKIVTNSAIANLKAAEASYKMRKESKQEYEQGLFASEIKRSENMLATAEEAMKSAEDSYAHKQVLAKKEFVTELELRTAKFQVIKYENDLKLAKLRLKTLIGPTYRRRMIELEANIEAANSRLIAAQRTLAVQEMKLGQIKEQIGFCTISVPEGVSGQVVYARQKERGRKEAWELKEGATVWQRLVLIRLPNLNLLRVEAMVDESQVRSVKVGMPASIYLPSLSGTQDIIGEVTTVNSYAEPSGYGSGGVTQYGVKIDVLNPPLGEDGLPTIRPGMNASVRIQTAFEKASLQIPVQCLVKKRGRSFGLVQSGTSFKTVEVTVLHSTKKVACIVDDESIGVIEGGQFVMNPRGYSEWFKLPQMKEDDVGIEFKDKTQPKKEMPVPSGNRGKGKGAQGKGPQGKGAQGKGPQGEPRPKGPQGRPRQQAQGKSRDLAAS